MTDKPKHPMRELADAIQDALDCHVNASGVVMFSIKQFTPDGWRRLLPLVRAACPYDPERTYWSGRGAHQVDYDRLWRELVPQSGPCATLAGELLRASSRIYHDYYNNGFGNDWSGALEYLRLHSLVPHDQLDRLEPYCRGDRGSEVKADWVARLLEDVADQVVAFVSELDRRGTLAQNPCDMLSLTVRAEG